MIDRPLGRGWFGTLGLPRVIALENLTRFFVEDGSTDVHLKTPPIPEIFDKIIRRTDIEEQHVLQPNETWSNETWARGSELAVAVKIMGPLEIGDDVAIHVLWSDDNAMNNARCAQGTRLPGVDLWDEINGDVYATDSGPTSADACAELRAFLREGERYMRGMDVLEGKPQESARAARCADRVE